MQIKHFAIFKNQTETLNWENLRNDETEQPYFIPFTKEDYISKVESDEPSRETQFILQETNNVGLRKIFSLGSGIAALEYQLKKFSDYSVVVTDNNSSVLRLKQFGVFDNAIILDALQDSLSLDKSWVVLFPRIDTEFDNHQLQELFAKCYNSGINHIFFIPAELLSLRIIIAEVKILIISIMLNKPRIFCGYARSMKSFQKIWNPYYKLEKIYKTDKSIFLLQSTENRR